MTLHNVRLGFATNSSSSHSIVILRPGTKASDLRQHDSDSNRYSFGWELFRLTKPERKLEYIIAQYVTNLLGSRDKNFTFDEVQTIVQELFGVNLTKKDYGDKNWPDISIDHQSVLNIPAKYTEFWRELSEFIQNDNVVIIGGNDNNERPDDDYAGGPCDDFSVYSKFRDTGHNNLTIRKDGDFWTIFNADSGAKVRISFKSDKPYVKATTPELVDLKITNFCTYGCRFCYQASTNSGSHAPKEQIFKIIRQLKSLGVFEIAIGGGEPTTHPNFAEILKYARKHGIVPNFTTFSVAWLRDNAIVEAVSEYVGSIGVSVHKVSEIEKVKKIRNSKACQGSTGRGSKAVAQHVLGTLPMNETIELIETCSKNYIPLLLLGYKNVGFGANVVPEDFTDFPLILKLSIDRLNSWVTLSVDTAILNTYPDLLKVLAVDETLGTSEEGKFSCYIDAVTGQMGPSSYAPSSMSILPNTTRKIKELFATY